MSAIGIAWFLQSNMIIEGYIQITVIFRLVWCVKKLQNWKLNVKTTRICIFSWSPMWSMLQEVCKPWRHYCKKSAKRRVLSECLGGEFDFLLIEAALPRLFKKDEADSCHRWSQYNALPGRVKGRYSFRYPNKVQLRFWLIHARPAKLHFLTRRYTGVCTVQGGMYHIPYVPCLGTL